MKIEGDVSVESLMLPGSGSGAKTELGAVSARDETLRHPLEEPVAALDQPDGSEGTETVSKFCVKLVIRVPMRKSKLTMPRLFVPSCNCKVGEITLPHFPVATNEKVVV